MGKLDTQQTAVPRVESILRKELARGGKALSAVAPILSHLLSSSGVALVSEAIVARVGGMLADIARQVLVIARGANTGSPPPSDAIDRLTDYLAADSAILSHLYAAAMEANLTERLEAKHSIDPVLGPLLQELIGSEKPPTAELAMSTMAAQSRFMQNQRRMQLPIHELPADLFNLVVRRCASYVSENDDLGSANIVPTLKRGYDESTTRAGLMTRLVASMGEGARAALDIEHGGMAMFTTTLAVLTNQPRELAALACQERQGARLALCLRAAGLDEAAIERQFALIEPNERLPEGIEELSPARAQAILNNSVTRGVG